VAEIIGTLLLSESQLDYIEDARGRLAKPGAAIIPAGGDQYIHLVRRPSSPPGTRRYVERRARPQIDCLHLARVSSVSQYRGLDLTPFNQVLWGAHPPTPPRAATATVGRGTEGGVILASYATPPA
jgi:hypothetical protein